ncbi:MAG: hypothetical protein JO276_14565 [Sphingomonadaceae bacterium]|nr:hypothetical protein [Sphingomonadaceae bacterium]
MAAPSDPSAPLEQKDTELIALQDLRLDAENPRFGGANASSWDQADVLDHIVNTFGVEDVLSSIAINGYISAEPLVCRREEGSDFAIVVEGNRRLAACLILAGDARASRQYPRVQQYGQVWRDHGSKQIDPLPAIVFEGADRRQALLSYLGVRHIASAQPWDSYAKAAWVAQVVEENQLPLADVALMIGDQHKTIRRLLEGYYFVHQTIDAGEFRPQDSVRKGRGSVTEYPFSWVYTILGYTAARAFLGIDDREPRKTLLETDKLPRAGTITRAMFGDKSKGRSAAIEDSRELGDLAQVLADPDKVALLEAGKSVAEIGRLTKPIDQRVREGLTQVRSVQAEIVAGLSEQELAPDLAESLISLSGINRRTAEDIAKRITEAARGRTDV